MDARSTEFGVADAKARFSELLARAEAGESITISRHGRAVAKLIPAAKPKLTPEERLKSWEEWEAYRKKHDIRLGPDLTIAQLLRESRKYE
ncbi:MAG: Antitoxin Phd YefM, type toxin-antitoxin system [Sphingomonadales bacterium]|jgi:prevent-host-death family protein|nr:Antitoxin Phd YefM, type toxin-antitoxin system [Sphingomonadales bacterium]